MKHIIVFNIPQEQEELEVYLKAVDNACILHELDETMRRWLKHGFPQCCTLESIAQYVRDMIRE